MALGKTTPERLRYDTPESRYLSKKRRPISGWVAADGEVAPVKSAPGVLSELHEIRDARRARPGRSPQFTQAEHDRLIELIPICLAAGWSRGEVARAIGATKIDRYVKAARS